MTLEQARQNVAYHMEQIVACFKKGVKITVIVRTPDLPERDFLMTDDDLDEAGAVLTRRKEAGMAKGPDA